MSGKRKPFLHSPKDSSSDEDSNTFERSLSEKGDSVKKVETSRKSSACNDTDVDDDNVASPSDSSTASGPVYVRPPGYKFHGQEIAVKGLSVKGKKKKTFFSSDKEVMPSKLSISSLGSLKNKVSSSFLTSFTSTLDKPSNLGATNVQLKPKVKREPLPMKLRALPQSFWQQPNLPIDVSPGQIYAKLPPLISKDAQDVADIRPVTPPADPNRKAKCTEDVIRTVKVSNTDWLYKLFNGLDGSPKMPSIKRGRPKKVPSTMFSQVLKNDDPCLGSTSAEGPLPPLSHEKIHHYPTLTMISLRDRDKSVSLPALHVERNYSQLLSELVVKL